MPFSTLVLIADLTVTALLAGFFYAFSCAAMPGLSRVNDRVFVSSMVSINDAVRNPLFALGFYGPFVFGIAVLVPSAGSGAPYLPAVVLSFILYLASLAITFTRNIPLNIALEREAGRDVEEARRRFEGPWNRANALRFLTSTAAVVALAVALVQAG